MDPSRTPPPFSPFFSMSCSFEVGKWQNNRLDICLGVDTPLPPGKSWIRHYSISNMAFPMLLPFVWCKWFLPFASCEWPLLNTIAVIGSIDISISTHGLPAMCRADHYSTTNHLPSNPLTVNENWMS